MYLHISLLPDAEGPVGSLVLDRRVPPAVKVENIVGRRQINACPAGLE